MKIGLFTDYFTDGDYTNAEGSNGLSWNVIEGQAEINNGRLGIYRGNSTIITNQQISTNEFTITLAVWQTWSTPSLILFLYLDQNNYYALGVSNKDGVYRVMDLSLIHI